MARMINKLGYSRHDPEVISVGMVVYPIASACYPRAIEKNEDGIMPPLPHRSVQDIRRKTEQVVDRGIGSVDDLYSFIWGVKDFKEYMEKFIGAELAKEDPSCYNCYAEVSEGARFCNQCGTHLNGY